MMELEAALADLTSSITEVAQLKLRIVDLLRQLDAEKREKQKLQVSLSVPFAPYF